jgi:predicted nucleic acid-binding protein
MDFPAEYFTWDALADRIWDLRHNLTSADASYVAVAEMASATLITKDRRIAAAPGIRCAVEVLP